LLIGASTTIADFLLPPILGAFKVLYPAVVPRLFVANSAAVQIRIAERSLDLAFIEGDSHLPTLGADVCCEDELQVVCAPSHSLAKQTFATPQSLMEHAYISREVGSGTREVIDHYLQKAGLVSDSLQVVMEAGSPEALKGLAATGLGFAIMSRAIVAKEVRLGELGKGPSFTALDTPLVGRVSERNVALQAASHREHQARSPIRSKLRGRRLSSRANMFSRRCINTRPHRSGEESRKIPKEALSRAGYCGPATKARSGSKAKASVRCSQGLSYSKEKISPDPAR